MSVRIELRGIKRSFVNGEIETPVLHGIDLKIDEGEFVAIMGPSGSGKSTLMHILGFLDHASGGEYRYNGVNVAGLSSDELALKRRTEVGFVFQAFHLLPNSTVFDNVVLPMLYSGVPLAERRTKALNALKQVHLDHRVDFLSNRISGGERQRVAIARALVNEPRLLCADEPTGNLDTASGLEVLKIFQRINDAGRTIIMVTHEEEAAAFAKRIVRMRDGKIVSDEVVKERQKHSFTK